MIRLRSEAGRGGFVAVPVFQHPCHSQRLLLRQSDALAHAVMGAVPVADVDLGRPAVPGYEVDFLGPGLVLDLIPVDDADVIHSAVVIMVYLQIPIVGPEALLLFAHNQNISVRPVPLHVESH